jgi:hypothetical protein
MSAQAKITTSDNHMLTTVSDSMYGAGMGIRGTKRASSYERPAERDDSSNTSGGGARSSYNHKIVQLNPTLLK